MDVVAVENEETAPKVGGRMLGSHEGEEGRSPWGADGKGMEGGEMGQAAGERSADGSLGSCVVHSAG